MSTSMQFDYVVVGAGSAGCVLADRLSAGGDASVLLLEAGPPDSSLWIRMPAGNQKAVADPRIAWGLATEPEAAMLGRRMGTPRARTLGGCSSINAMLYLRGQPADYDDWARLGATGWSWADVLPYFKRSEANDRGADALHGAEGPLRVSSFHDRSVLGRAFIDAGLACGLPANEDFNGAAQEGLGFYQYTGYRGRRWSTAVAFLRRARGRSNLRIETEAEVDVVLFAEDSRRATGVRFRKRGATLSAAARREVILAAGAFHSPAILQRSGIGPGSLLAEHGVPVRVDAPEVGANLQDHLQARLVYEATEPVSLNEIYHSPLRQAIAGLRWVLTHSGPLSEPPIRAGGFLKSDDAIDRPDIQFHLGEFSNAGSGEPLHRYHGFMQTVCALRPESRGYVHLRSADPSAKPIIVKNYLSAPGDCAITVRGMRIARRIAAAAPLAGLIRREVQPGPDATSDQALLDSARATASSVYHPVGTCRMGSDVRSVLDPSLRVRGVEGLRVADGSVMPRLVSGNTNAPIIMIGERAADLILSAWRT